MDVQDISESALKDTIKDTLARIERAMLEPLKIDELRDVLVSLAPTTKLLDEIENASRSSTPMLESASAEAVADAEMRGEKDGAVELADEETLTSSYQMLDAEEESASESAAAPADAPSMIDEADPAPDSPSASSDEEEAMPVVEGVSAHVQKIEQELVALEKLPAEFTHAGAEEKAIGKAIYRAKAASNDLMNHMLKLDGVTIVSAENRPKRKAVVSSIHALLDRLDAVHDELKQAQDAAALASSAAADAQRQTERDWADSMQQRVRQQCQLQPDVQHDEYDGCYAMFIRGTAIQPNDVDLSLSSDGRHLELALCQLPSADELLSMARALRQRGVAAAGVDAQVLCQLNGKYGTYSAKLELPWDADAGAIQKESKNGALTIVVPKVDHCRAGFARRPMSARGVHGKPYNTRVAPRRPQSARGYNHMHDPFRGFLDREGILW